MISVILPAYNVERFAARALESVIAQGYPRLELVFVDDASTDATCRVAEKILHSCERSFQLLRREENGGVSAARNAGLRAARGEYVCFIDPDDFIEAGYLATLYGIISSQRADIAFCGFNHYYEDTGTLVPERFRLKKPLPQASDYLFAWHMRKLTASVWCFLYRKDFCSRREFASMKDAAGAKTANLFKRPCCAAPRPCLQMSGSIITFIIRRRSPQWE